jgi:hypothetical protein
MAAEDIEIDDDNDDYYKVQHTWSKEMKYHKDHFLYAKLPENVNPEFLEQGQSYITKLDDVKDSYGQATAHGTDKDVGDSGLTLTGGKKLGAIKHFEDDIETGTKASFGVKVPIGKPSQMQDKDDAILADGSDTKTPGESSAVSAENSEDHELLEDVPDEMPEVEIVEAEHVSGGKPMWEWQHRDHWIAYADDCNEYIEKRYQEFIGTSRGKGKGKSKGHSYIHVKTQGKEISIDFGKMTSKTKDSTKTSQIRRREP